MIVGNDRSGTTIVGSIIDSHPSMICANESQASGLFWRGYDRDTILDEIVRNSELNYALGRQSSGYVYRIETPKKDRFSLKVAADKIWNPALLLLAGQHDLLSTLSARLECRPGKLRA